MLELLVYVFFAVAFAVGALMTIAIWAAVVGWIVAGIAIVFAVLWIAVHILRVFDRAVEWWNRPKPVEQ